MRVDDFANYLSLIRKEANLSQGDVAKTLSFTTQAISKWENGLSLPDLYTVGKLAKLYKVDINSFFSFANKKNDSYAEEYEFDIDAFAKRFRELRKFNHLSQTVLAERIYTTQQTIVKIEKGETTPTIFQFIDMCNLYGISYEVGYYPQAFKLNLHMSKTRTILTSGAIGASAILIALAIAMPFIVHNEPAQYQVKFYDYDYQTVIWEGDYIENELLKSDRLLTLANPSRPDTDLYTYTFVGWDINHDGSVDHLPIRVNFSFDAFPIFSQENL